MAEPCRKRGKVGQSKMPGHRGPACDLQQIARADRNEWILNVVGRRRDGTPAASNSSHPREPARRQCSASRPCRNRLAAAASRSQCRRARPLDDASGLRRRNRAECAAMARGDASLHAVRARALDHRIKQTTCRLSRCSSICMSSGRPLRSANSKRRSRKRSGSSAYCGTPPMASAPAAIAPPAIVARHPEFARRIAGQMRNHLQASCGRGSVRASRSCLPCRAVRSAFRYWCGCG